MAEKSRSNYYFYSALILAIWFMLTSCAWTYLANVFVSFPFGLLSLILWYKGKQIDAPNKRFTIIAVLLILGVVSAIGTFFYLWAFN